MPVYPTKKTHRISKFESWSIRLFASVGVCEMFFQPNIVYWLDGVTWAVNNISLFSVVIDIDTTRVNAYFSISHFKWSITACDQWTFLRCRHTVQLGCKLQLGCNISFAATRLLLICLHGATACNNQRNMTRRLTLTKNCSFKLCWHSVH